MLMMISEVLTNVFIVNVLLTSYTVRSLYICIEKTALLILMRY